MESKPVGPNTSLNTKKRFFNDKRTQSIGITIAKMPVMEKITLALSSMDESLLQKNHVSSLQRGK